MPDRGDDIAEIRAALVDRAGDLAQHLLGASNVKLSSRREPRWGNHGSFSVIVDGPKAGVWRDDETNEAGDVLMRERRCDFLSAIRVTMAQLIKSSGTLIGFDPRAGSS